MTLTPEQMDEAVKEMAKDFRPVTASDGSHTARFATDDEIRNGWKEPLGQALLAALPVIRRAVLEEAAREAWRASQWARNTPDDIAAAIRTLGAKP